MLNRLVLAALALLLFAGFAKAEDITFTGEVTYRERIALPQGAELWVSLVTRPGNAVVASAAATIADPAQVPLSFTLNVRSTTLKGSGAYGLRAEIRVKGRTLFRSAQPVPVDIVSPSPTSIVVSFSPDGTVEPEPIPAPQIAAAHPLLNSSWIATSIAGSPTLPETKVSLAIAPDRRAGGHSGCNNYFTEASFEPDALSFGPIAGTKMACAPDVMKQEAALFAALAATAGFEASGKTLKLLDAAGVTLVGLVQSP